MSRPWLALWREAPNDPKIRALSYPERALWWGLLCLTDDTGTVSALPGLTLVATLVATLAWPLDPDPERTVGEGLRRLADLELVALRGKTLSFPAWEKRQPRGAVEPLATKQIAKSQPAEPRPPSCTREAVAERVRRLREARRGAVTTPVTTPCNDPVTTPCNDPVTTPCNDPVTTPLPACNDPLHLSDSGSFSGDSQRESARARPCNDPVTTPCNDPVTTPCNDPPPPFGDVGAPRCGTVQELHGLESADILQALLVESKGKVDVRCTSTIEAAFAVAVRDVGYTLEELRALGRAARTPAKLWPWAAEKLGGRAKVTLPFLLGKRDASGNYEATPLTDAMAVLRAMPEPQAPPAAPPPPRERPARALPPEEAAAQAQAHRPRFGRAP